jgi:SAM-dependent methyltransferase
MPACQDCSSFQTCQTLDVALKEAKKACDNAIFAKHLPDMDGEILEVGHGVLRTYARRLGRRGKTWKGIDPRWPDNIRVGHYEGSASKIPFPDNSQDWVFSFASIEHWYEYGESPQDGISEIHRVLKSGGKMLLSIPIHYHGDDLFYYGKEEQIAKLCKMSDWKSINWEPWRREYDPLPKLEAWKEVAHRKQKTEVLRAANASAWWLEVFAEKA